MASSTYVLPARANSTPVLLLQHYEALASSRALRSKAGIIYRYQSNPAMTLETWHDYSLPFGAFAYDRARVTPQSYWLPTVVTYGGPKGKIPNSPIQSTTITRWEAEDFIIKQLERGLAVEVWDQTPTCLTKQIFAAGPCSPLTCDIGRPMRGAGPRYK